MKLNILTIGGSALTFAALLHASRFFMREDIVQYVRPWMSGLAAILLILLVMGYLRLYHSLLEKTGRIYYVTVGVFCAAALLHIIRVLLIDSLLLMIPLWASAVAVPIAGMLAYWNFKAV